MIAQRAAKTQKRGWRRPRNTVFYKQRRILISWNPTNICRCCCWRLQHKAFCPPNEAAAYATHKPKIDAALVSRCDDKDAARGWGKHRFSWEARAVAAKSGRSIRVRENPLYRWLEICFVPCRRQVARYHRFERAKEESKKDFFLPTFCILWSEGG